MNDPGEAVESALDDNMSIAQFQAEVGESWVEYHRQKAKQAEETFERHSREGWW